MMHHIRAASHCNRKLVTASSASQGSSRLYVEEANPKLSHEMKVQMTRRDCTAADAVLCRIHHQALSTAAVDMTVSGAFGSIL